MYAEYLPLRELYLQSRYMMWFKRNGHFAKIEKTESEVPDEFSKIETTLHPRV
jgi:hypothetical protein